MLALAGCAPPAERVEQLLVFRSTAEIRLRGGDPATAQAALAEVSAALAQREREWHAWESSDVTRINQAFAAGEPAQAPASVVDLVRRAQPLSVATDGLFDPAIGGLVEAWGFIPPPSPSSPRCQAMTPWHNGARTGRESPG